jgi:hypothetical protein
VSDQGHFQEALTLATQAIDIDPSRWEAYVIAGAARVSQGHCMQANELLDKAINRAPDAKKAAITDVKKRCTGDEAPSGSQDAQTIQDRPAVSAQSNQNEGPNLQETMVFIQQKLNGQPGYSIQIEDVEGDPIAGFVTDGIADPNSCTVSWRVSEELFDRGKPSNTFDRWYTVPLKSVQDIRLEPIKHDAGGQIRQVSLVSDAITLKMEQTDHYKGKDYPKGIQNSSSENEAPIPFNDPSMAERMLKAIQQASALCGAKHSPF